MFLKDQSDREKLVQILDSHHEFYRTGLIMTSEEAMKPTTTEKQAVLQDISDTLVGLANGVTELRKLMYKFN